ncbi:MAG: DNA mismatch repair endonuclease MutL, partial [Firmicutes bacterium]|nr:DNA mismatch repair endonuclease MutL [Bacillota bacterium]
MRIIRLAPEVANKIAAGEVVERPASVVKELVENSIDAGARNINVETLGGGLELIMVADDGCGMGREDAARAFERHATSKISRAEDLFSIDSLGFRGEALPSIASVARVRLVTCEQGSGEGTVVVAEGGRVGEPAPIGAPCGTTVAVRDLFFNTPARLKYLRTVSTENRRIVDIVGSLALAHPEIGFALKVDGRSALATPQGGSIEEAAAAVLGLDVAREMVPLASYSHGVSVEGLVSLPHRAKGKRRDKQYVFVNRRPVTSTTVWSAIDRAYDRTIPAGVRPPVVLSIEVDPSMIDVNVHPAKSEVRFASSSDVYSAVHGAVSSVLRSADAVPGIEQVGPADGWSPSASDTQRRSHAPQPAARAAISYATEDRQEIGSTWQPQESALREVRPSPGLILGKSGFTGERPEVIGQLNRTYILTQGESGLVIIDQHVAHERILVEKYREEFRKEKPSVQLLLAPEVVEIGASDVEIVSKHADVLARMGYELDVFGETSVVIRGIPAQSGGIPPAESLMAAIEGIVAAPPGSDAGLLGDQVAISLACRGSVKAGDALSAREMESLVERLFECEDPYRCPHGRPVVVVVPKDAL